MPDISQILGSIEDPTGLFFCVIAFYPILAALFDWDWFMNNRKTQFFVRMFGRDGARIFYACMGIACFVFGILLANGVIQPEGRF